MVHRRIVLVTFRCRSMFAWAWQRQIDRLLAATFDEVLDFFHEHGEIIDLLGPRTAQNIQAFFRCSTRRMRRQRLARRRDLIDNNAR